MCFMVVKTQYGTFSMNRMVHSHSAKPRILEEILRVFITNGNS